ncbi:MAG: ABC transporter permease [Clostridiales bacterium]|nr:ABC transporter permease [Clostridiales bacterium]
MKKHSKNSFWGLWGAQNRMVGRHRLFWLFPLLAIRLLLPKDWQNPAAVLLAMVVACEAGILSMSMAVHEKENRLMPAFYIAGVKPGKYFLSKLLSGIIPMLLTGLIVIWFSDPDVLVVRFGKIKWDTVLNGDTQRLLKVSASSACMYLLASGFAMGLACFCSTVSGYSFAGIVLLVLLAGPAVWDAFFPLEAGFGFHPGVMFYWYLQRPELLAPPHEISKYYPLAAAVLLLISLLLGLICAGAMIRGKGGQPE